MWLNDLRAPPLRGAAASAAEVPPATTGRTKMKLLGLVPLTTWAHQCGQGYPRRPCLRCSRIEGPKKKQVFCTMKGECYHEDPRCTMLQGKQTVCFDVCETKPGYRCPH